MATVEENIEILSRTMLSEANAEAEKTLAEARARAEAIRQQAQEQAAAVRKAILEQAQQEVDRLRGQAIATTELQARNKQLEYREKLLNSVFQATREKLPTVRQWSNYDEISLALLKEALLHLKDYPVQVRVDPIAQRLINDARLDQLARDLKVQIKDCGTLEQGTGVVVETDDGHLNYDNTLETRLTRLQNILRAQVYHILMGEQV